MLESLREDAECLDAMYAKTMDIARALHAAKIEHTDELVRRFGECGRYGCQGAGSGIDAKELYGSFVRLLGRRTEDLLAQNGFDVTVSIDTEAAWNGAGRGRESDGDMQPRRDDLCQAARAMDFRTIAEALIARYGGDASGIAIAQARAKLESAFVELRSGTLSTRFVKGRVVIDMPIYQNSYKTDKKALVMVTGSVEKCVKAIEAIHQICCLMQHPDAIDHDAGDLFARRFGWRAYDSRDVFEAGRALTLVVFTGKVEFHMTTEISEALQIAFAETAQRRAA